MNRFLNGSIALLIFGLMLVWPVMFTIGLRYSLAGLLCIFTIAWWYSNRKAVKPFLMRKPVLWASGILISLSAWYVIQAAWIIPEADWVWRELKGQWLKDMIFFGMGLVLGVGALRQQNNGSNQWLFALFFGLVGIVVWNVTGAVWQWFSTGTMPMMYGGATGTRTLDSYINNMLLAFLVGDLLARAHARKFLAWNSFVTIALLIVCFVNTVFVGTRHGWIGVAMLSVSSTVVYCVVSWRKRIKTVFLLLPVLTFIFMAGGWLSWKMDHRWNTLKETVPIAWDIDTHKAWLNHEKFPYPQLPSGQRVDVSNYERPAWIHAGLRLVKNRPLGAGFSRHAFGNELARLYPENEPDPGMHAHSSMVDLAIGGGVPALIMWFGFAMILISVGAAAYFRHGSGAGLVLLFLTSGFLGRSFLDSVMRDHSMEQFMFIVAFLLPMAVYASYGDNDAVMENKIRGTVLG